VFLASASRLQERTTPTNRREWWVAKLEGNAARDKLHQRALRKLGWRAIIVWECQTEKPKSLETFARRLRLSGASRAERIL
jgi:DNA mismatch endonuclease (patch repair protein)